MEMGSSWVEHLPSIPIFPKNLVMEMECSWNGHMPSIPALQENSVMEMALLEMNTSPPSQSLTRIQ